MVTNHEPAGELLIPTALPAHARERLATIDAATIRAVDSLAMSSESYRHSGVAYRHAKQFVRADEADRMADLIDLDPRLVVAGTMYHASTGTLRYFLHLYIGLLRRQAQARQAPSRSFANAAQRNAPRRFAARCDATQLNATIPASKPKAEPF